MSRPDRTASGVAALWLGLVRQRYMTRLVQQTKCTMTDGERVKLLDAAMHSHGPVGYLAGIQGSFEDAGREGDATMTGALRALIEAGEIEVLMSMRAEWLGLRSLLQSSSSLGL